MKDKAASLFVIFGWENFHWIHCRVDPVEWTDPGYYKQN
ncbi:hypothetical protein ES703_100780 [subsurface metagenome]